MDLGLEGASAIVAGGSSGLGLAVARALLAEGARVSIGARSGDRLEAAAALLREVGPGPVHTYPVDVLDRAGVREWVSVAAEALGDVRIVVANSGGPPAGGALEFDLDAYREATEISMLSQIGLVQEALPHVRAAPWGRILFIASQSVRQPVADLALSNTARAGVLGYAKSLMHALGPGSVTVNVLAPGSHRTPRLEQLAVRRADGDLEAGLRRMAEQVPLGRVGDPDEFGALAAFLASSRAGYITGAVIPVDGGVTQLLL